MAIQHKHVSRSGWRGKDVSFQDAGKGLVRSDHHQRFDENTRNEKRKNRTRTMKRVYVGFRKIGESAN
jgi:hypothetical protein